MLKDYFQTDRLQLKAFNTLRSSLSPNNVSLPKSGRYILKEDFQHDENGILRTYKINGVETLRTIPPAYYLNNGTPSPVPPEIETASQPAEPALETAEETTVEDSHLVAQAELERLEDRIYELDVIRVGDEDEAGTSTEVNPHEISRSSTPSSLFDDDLIESCDTECDIKGETVRTFFPIYFPCLTNIVIRSRTPLPLLRGRQSIAYILSHQLHLSASHLLPVHPRLLHLPRSKPRLSRIKAPYLVI